HGPERLASGSGTPSQAAGGGPVRPAGADRQVDPQPERDGGRPRPAGATDPLPAALTLRRAAMAASKDQIVAALQKAYNMELETVTNYLANSIHLDGVRADAIKKALTADITGELAHATQVGHLLRQ